MNKLEFSTNWNNKLECKFFTTIRIYNPSKHFNGNKFDVYLQKKHKYKAVVIGSTVGYLKELNDYVCYLDTGYNKAETTDLFLKMYPKIDFKNQQIVILLLKKIEAPNPIQQTIFN